MTIKNSSEYTGNTKNLHIKRIFKSQCILRRALQLLSFLLLPLAFVALFARIPTSSHGKLRSFESFYPVQSYHNIDGITSKVQIQTEI